MDVMRYEAVFGIVNGRGKGDAVKQKGEFILKGL
jgi:hypothetical protein